MYLIRTGIGEAGSWYPACAPDNLSNLRFWDALNGEAWLVNATSYGHGDILWEFLADDVIGVSSPFGLSLREVSHLEIFLVICADVHSLQPNFSKVIIYIE